MESEDSLACSQESNTVLCSEWEQSTPRPPLLFFEVYLGAFARLRKATFSVVMSVCLSVRPSAYNNSASIGRIFIKCDIWEFFENQFKKFKFH